MNKRKSLAEFTHKADNFLTVSRNTYKQWVFRYTFLELEKDLVPFGDVTSNALVSKDALVSGIISSKASGVLAGVNEIRYFLVDSDPHFRPSIKGDFDVEFFHEDGDRISPGDKIMKISGNARDVLAIERVVLNLLMRMSGVATFTRKLIDKIPRDVLLVPTRKTIWGLLDKRAVVVGGGGTHRLNLSDAILVKDNHLAAVSYDFKAILSSISKMADSVRFVEIEVETQEHALKCAKAFHDAFAAKVLSDVGVIMLDNFSVEDIAATIGRVKEAGYYDDVLFEASGGVTSETVVDYASSGVDIVSMGELTTGASSLDFGMELEK